MIKVLWLRRTEGGGGSWREALNSFIPPALQSQSGREAARILGEDPRVSILVVSPDVTEEELHELGEGIRHRSAPLEVICLTVDSAAPRALIPILHSHEITPWVLAATGGREELESLLDQVAEKALARRNLFEVRQGMIVRAGFVGHSEANLRLVDLMSRAGDSDDPVLISGPEGAEHGRAARLIHHLSPRRNQGPLRFVPPEIHSREDGIREIFGEVKPGVRAADRSPYLLDQTSGGTLVFTGIESATQNLQMRLVELISTGQYFPVGSGKPELADVRIILTTSTNLVDLVKKDGFRGDLLNEFASDPIELPPLDQRRVDIPALVDHFSADVWNRHQGGGSFPGFLPEALEHLSTIDWPCDREGLRHFVEWLLLLDGLDRKRPFTTKEVRREVDRWLPAAKRRSLDCRDLQPLHFCRRFRLDYDRLTNEILYGFLAIQKRRKDKQQIADLFRKSSRWVEITTKDLANWFLDNGHREDEELKRDQIWSRRFKR